MKRSHVIALGALVALAFVGAYLGSPWLTLQTLKSAMERGDRDRLERLVDFPRVRESLKSDLTAMTIKQMQSDPAMRDNPFAGLSVAMAPTLVAGLVDGLVNPATLAQLANAKSMEDASSAAEPTAPAPEAAAAPPPPPARKAPDFSYSYAGVNSFRAQSKDGPAFLLDRQGLFSWRVVRIELPESFFEDR